MRIVKICLLACLLSLALLSLTLGAEESGSASLTIHYRYEDGSEAFPDETVVGAIGEEIIVTPPEIKGFDATLSGTEPPAPIYLIKRTLEGNTELTVIYLRRSYSLSINFYDMDGREVGKYEAAIPYGERYSFRCEDLITGYTPAFETIEGTMDAENEIFSVPVTPNIYTLIVHYRFADGSPAAHSLELEIPYMASCRIHLPALEGYLVENPEDAEAVMDTLGKTVVIRYHKAATLTVRYCFKDGKEVDAPYVELLPSGRAYSIVSPRVIGYRASRSVVTGVMGEEDVTIRVIYQKEGTFPLFPILLGSAGLLLSSCGLLILLRRKRGGRNGK